MVRAPGPGPTPGGGSTSPNNPSKKCAAAKAKVASLQQQANSAEAQNETKTYLKELGAGALIGCALGAVGVEGVSTTAGGVAGGLRAQSPARAPEPHWQWVRALLGWSKELRWQMVSTYFRT